MSEIRIARVVGARPQFMQVPQVAAALKDAGIGHLLVHTGQHYDSAMSDAFFQDLGLPDPDVNLGVGGLTQGAGTGRMIEKMEGWLMESRPDAVLVDGDTNSTMAAALAAVKLHIPVFHIEAGLRDWDRRRPEEINRVVTDAVASLNFAPIPRAMRNLQAEGRAETAILAGDVLLDCFLAYHPRRRTQVREQLGLAVGTYALMTLHRPENTDLAEFERFSEIMAALKAIGTKVVWPVHPRARPVVEQYRRTEGLPENLILLDPVAYLDMLGLLDGCDMVLTDSGGLPREAVWNNKKCVMLFRMDTWHDMLEYGWAQIGKTDRHSILDAVGKAIIPGPAGREYFGGGRASANIADAIIRWFRSDMPPPVTGMLQ
jgi:UDP-N-acetylglucosamine 2-epimerase